MDPKDYMLSLKLLEDIGVNPFAGGNRQSAA
jgi:hypothetical protein